MASRCVIIALMLGLAAASGLLAQDTPPPQSGTTSQPDEAAADDVFDENRPIGVRGQSPDAGGQYAVGDGESSWLGTTLLSLAVVVGLIVAAAWALKRWGPSSLGGGRGGLVKVLARCPLSAKQSIAVVHVGKRVLLLGVTGQQINLLADIEDDDEVEQLLAGAGSGGSGVLGEGFSQLLGKQSKEMADADDESGAEASAGKALGQLSQLIGQVKSRLGSRPGPKS